jgi:hypothetical protein
LDVTRQRRRTQQLAESAIGLAAQRVHLEQPVARLHVALQEQEVSLSRREDVRHAVRVANDLRGRADAEAPGRCLGEFGCEDLRAWQQQQQQYERAQRTLPHDGLL